MPSLPQAPTIPVLSHQTAHLPERRLHTLGAWAESFSPTFVRLWTMLVHTVNALCKVDTLANRPATPELNETFFVASDTDRTYVAVNGAWREVGRLAGTSGGAVQFSEIADPAAPAANEARLYVKDNGAGKTQLAVRFATGVVQVIATEP